MGKALVFDFGGLILFSYQTLEALQQVMHYNYESTVYTIEKKKQLSNPTNDFCQCDTSWG